MNIVVAVTTRLSILLTLTMFFSACQWVNPHDPHETIVIAQQQHIVNCRPAGNINAQTKHKIIFSRNEKKVAEELQILARNEALKLKANTLVAVTNVHKGKQQFAAFNCSR